MDPPPLRRVSWDIGPCLSASHSALVIHLWTTQQIEQAVTRDAAQGWAHNASAKGLADLTVGLHPRSASGACARQRSLFAFLALNTAQR